MRVALALVRALIIYWFVVFPQARREIKAWDSQARAISDPRVRRHAVGKLNSERIVAEGAAAFATLAAARHRTAVIRVCVAYEVMYDYVDALGEDAVADSLAHNRCVHGALIDAFTPSGPLHDHFRHHACKSDDGYLKALIGACRQGLAMLPAHQAVLPALQRFAARASTAQSLNHAGTTDSHRPLETWARLQQIDDAHWWEVAAAASDPLGVFALLAAAGNRKTTAGDVAAIETAYYPWMGALVWLMESLTDEDDDDTSGNHSYAGRYASPVEAADRLAVIARRAATAAAGLRQGPRHIVLLSGVISLYLSSPGSNGPLMRACAHAIRNEVRGPIAPLVLILRLRRSLKRPPDALRQT